MQVTAAWGSHSFMLSRAKMQSQVLSIWTQHPPPISFPFPQHKKGQNDVRAMAVPYLDNHGILLPRKEPCERSCSWLQGHTKAGLHVLGQGTVPRGMCEMAAAAQEGQAAQQVSRLQYPCSGLQGHSCCEETLTCVCGCPATCQCGCTRVVGTEDTLQSVSPGSGRCRSLILQVKTRDGFSNFHSPTNSKDRDTNTSNDSQLQIVKLKNLVLLAKICNSEISFALILTYFSSYN